jgi:hypothetical protein
VYESEAKTPSPRAGGPRGGWLPAEAGAPEPARSDEAPQAPSDASPPAPPWTPPGVSTGRDDRVD